MNMYSFVWLSFILVSNTIFYLEASQNGYGMSPKKIATCSQEKRTFFKKNGLQGNIVRVHSSLERLYFSSCNTTMEALQKLAELGCIPSLPVGFCYNNNLDPDDSDDSDEDFQQEYTQIDDAHRSYLGLIDWENLNTYLRSETIQLKNAILVKACVRLGYINEENYQSMIDFLIKKRWVKTNTKDLSNADMYDIDIAWSHVKPYRILELLKTETERHKKSNHPLFVHQSFHERLNQKRNPK